MPVLKYRPDESSSWQTVGITADGYTKAEADAAFTPSGYGYGESLEVYSLDDSDGTLLRNKLNEIISAMPYNSVKRITFTCYPFINGSPVFGTIYKTDNGSGTPRGFVEIAGYDGMPMARMYLFKDGWQPFEWVNPPMALGVEYRTTERYLGKPVYVKVVSIDGLPNNGIKTFPWSDSYTNMPFFVTGHAMRSNGGSYMSLPTDVYHSLSGSPMNGMVSISAIEKQIVIKTDFDATSFDTVTVCVKYTKTTD